MIVGSEDLRSLQLSLKMYYYILLQLFEATCVRNVLIVKHLEHEKFKDWYHVKEERLFYLEYRWR